MCKKRHVPENINELVYKHNVEYARITRPNIESLLYGLSNNNVPVSEVIIKGSAFCIIIEFLAMCCLLMIA